MATERITVFGAGSIATAWAIVFASGGPPVTLFDPDKGHLAKSKAELLSRLDDLATFSLLKETPTQVGLRIHTQTDPALARADAEYVALDAIWRNVHPLQAGSIAWNGVTDL